LLFSLSPIQKLCSEVRSCTASSSDHPDADIFSKPLLLLLRTSSPPTPNTGVPAAPGAAEAPADAPPADVPDDDIGGTPADDGPIPSSSSCDSDATSRVFVVAFVVAGSLLSLEEEVLEVLAA
jgi:hypothetical protein